MGTDIIRDTAAALVGEVRTRGDVGEFGASTGQVGNRAAVAVPRGVAAQHGERHPQHPAIADTAADRAAAGRRAAFDDHVSDGEAPGPEDVEHPVELGAADGRKTGRGPGQREITQHVEVAARRRVLVGAGNRQHVRVGGQRDAVGAGQRVGLLDCRAQRTGPRHRSALAVARGDVDGVAVAVDREGRGVRRRWAAERRAQRQPGRTAHHRGPPLPCQSKSCHHSAFTFPRRCPPPGAAPSRAAARCPVVPHFAIVPPDCGGRATSRAVPVDCGPGFGDKGTWLSRSPRSSASGWSSG